MIVCNASMRLFGWDVQWAVVVTGIEVQAPVVG